ncbi:pyridoxamine 5'-phosphate oxidase family protein [Microbacterium halotolerans]|uniref:pyridoxamine 5'-phosphate oxidase family protein n=1 Tax=Microbacterium halotolerans TaxID=246613 RepID=UPI000E6A950D|nr:pyridoxamine 5'-phosphate oxidase family protein [Microbacterium halotolerans]
MDSTEVVRILSLPYSEELLARDILRMAYVAKDGSPRIVPMGFVWNGTSIVVCTTTNAPKLRHLRENPQVALTIDTEVFPPKILLIRGDADLELVDGIPDEYMSANNVYSMTDEQRTEWEKEVRSLYKQMYRITITPTWAKLIDFETTLPSAVAELIEERTTREGA